MRSRPITASASKHCRNNDVNMWKESKMRLLGLIVIPLMTANICMAVEEVYRIDNVVVTYDGIEQQYVQAIARVAAAARKVAV